jgi:uncharacterized membrane protein YhaH (DUF805 family)
MAVPQYKITFEGQLLPGTDKPTAVRNLATLFEASEEAVERLFDGRKLALKRHLLLEDTHKFVPMLEKAGIQTQLEDDTPFDPAGAEILAGGATYDDVAYSPWTTPKSDQDEYLADQPAGGLFSLKGRLGRVNFAAWSALIALVAGFAATSLLPKLGLVMGSPLASLIISVGYLAATLKVSVKRLQDIGWSGWLILLSMIPVVGYVIGLLLLFMPGTRGPNRYGPQPAPAPSLVKLFVGFAAFCAVFTLGTLVWYFTSLRS